MVELGKQAWNAFIELSLKEIENDENIRINYQKYHIFSKTINEYYKTIKYKYMNEHVVFLDRHKVAAIITLAFIKVKPLEYINKDKDLTFVGNQKIGLSVALSFMCALFNSTTHDKNLPLIHGYIFPKVMTSENDYLDVLIRQLCLCDDNCDNVEIILFLSHIFYFLEVYTIEKLRMNYFEE